MFTKMHEYTSDIPEHHHPPVNQNQRGLKEGHKGGDKAGEALL